MAALDASGFTAKTLTDIKAELEAAFQAAFGSSIDLTPGRVFGKLIGILSEREALLWELAQSLYANGSPDTAAGAGLDGICAITGTTRDAATAGTVTETCVGTATTVIPAESRFSDGTNAFETDADATIAAVAAWVALTAYIGDDRVKNGGNVYQCLTGGTSAGSGGPTTTAADITDGTVHWKFLGAGSGVVDVPSTAVETGFFTAVSGTLTTIETPVSGWNAALNLSDAVPGTEEETDSALRLRREDELAAAGKSALEAIRSDVLDVDGVTACIVYENVTMLTDGDGVPPKAVEVVVQGGAAADIRAAIFASVGAGIEPYGTTLGTVTDSMGTAHTVGFTRPTTKDIYIEIDVKKDPDLFPSDGEDQIKAALVAYGNALGMGKDVVARALCARAFSISGVIDTPLCNIDTTPGPTAETTIDVNSREVSDFDTSRITVNLSDGTL